MKARSSLVIAALAVVLVPVARAQDPGLEGKWTIAVEGGIVTEVKGRILEHTEGSLFERPATVYSEAYRQTYLTGFHSFNGAVLLGYGVVPNGEIFARGNHYKLNPPENGFLGGTVTGSDLFIKLEPYEEWGLEFGYRAYLAWRTGLKSFIAPVAGVRFTERILMESAFVPDRSSVIFNVPLYEPSTVPVFGADIGFTIDLGSTFYLGLEAALRYQPKLSTAETLPGLDGVNDAGQRWSAPVYLVAGLRF
jgi:hypothetical protein